MVRKIIVIGIKFYKSFYAEKMLRYASNADFEIEFWDIKRWIYKELDPADDVYKNENGVIYRSLNNTWQILKTCCSAVRSDVVFLSAGHYNGRKMYALQMLICLLGGRYFITLVGLGIPLVEYKQLPDKSLIDYFPPEAAFVSENYKMYLPSKRACQKWNIVEINSQNYEMFLENERKNIGRIIQNRYVVFLDENLAFHVEQKMRGHYWVKDAKSYFAELNQLFDVIEKKYSEECGESIEVVIAAHPSAKSNMKDYVFGNRKIIFDQTANLVKYSEFVIVYTSTAIDLAVIYDRPILFYTSQDLNLSNAETVKGNVFRKLNDFFQPMYVRIDESLELIRPWKKVFYDKELYRTYGEKYLYKNKDTKRFLFETVFDYFRKYG